MELIEYRGSKYPKLQSEGFAAQYAFPLAKKFCKGVGYDIGYCKKEWKLPNAIGIDEGRLYVETDPDEIQATYSAVDLPYSNELDYIFSSHCLEHLQDYVLALDYWNAKLKLGGVLFLYLPNMDYQRYWQPENNRKHLHYINPTILQSYFNNRDTWTNVIVTQGYDLNGSFYCIAEKV